MSRPFCRRGRRLPGNTCSPRGPSQQHSLFDHEKFGGRSLKDQSPWRRKSVRRIRDFGTPLHLTRSAVDRDTQPRGQTDQVAAPVRLRPGSAWGGAAGGRVKVAAVAVSESPGELERSRKSREVGPAPARSASGIPAPSLAASARGFQAPRRHRGEGRRGQPAAASLLGQHRHANPGSFHKQVQQPEAVSSRCRAETVTRCSIRSTCVSPCSPGCRGSLWMKAEPGRSILITSRWRCR